MASEMAANTVTATLAVHFIEGTFVSRRGGAAKSGQSGERAGRTCGPAKCRSTRFPRRKSTAGPLAAPVRRIYACKSPGRSRAPCLSPGEGVRLDLGIVVLVTHPQVIAAVAPQMPDAARSTARRSRSRPRAFRGCCGRSPRAAQSRRSTSSTRLTMFEPMMISRLFCPTSMRRCTLNCASRNVVQRYANKNANTALANSTPITPNTTRPLSFVLAFD